MFLFNKRPLLQGEEGQWRRRKYRVVPVVLTGVGDAARGDGRPYSRQGRRSQHRARRSRPQRCGRVDQLAGGQISCTAHLPTAAAATRRLRRW
ncbi:hypothetical protein VPH35_114457 [Triticum aestivum]